MVRHMKEGLRVTRHGQEKIYALAPTYFSAQAFEAWRTTNSWPVKRDIDGDAFVESRMLIYVEEPLTPEQMARLVWSLDELKRRVEKAFANFTETTSGKIWGIEHSNRRPAPDLVELDYPPLITDIHDLHAHYRDELKAYENVSATPAVPPPAPGEPHSYPEPPSERPAPIFTPTLETAE